MTKTKSKIALLIAFILILTMSFSQGVKAEESHVRTKPIPPAVSQIAVPYQPTFTNAKLSLEVPEVTLNSNDAKKVNQSIQDLENALISYYQGLEKEEKEYYFASIHYEAEEIDHVLSLRLMFLDGNMTGLGEQTFIYNFDTSTGKLLTDKELVEKLTGLEDPDMDVLFEENIRGRAEQSSKYEEALSMNADINGNPDGFRPLSIGLKDLFLGSSLEAYKRFKPQTHFFGKEISLPDSKLFLDKTGGISFIYYQGTSAGAGFFLQTAPFFPYHYPKGRLLNSSFVDLMRKLNRDPEKEECMALIAYLGDATDVDSLLPILQKTTVFSEHFFNYESPTPMLAINHGDDITGYQENAEFKEFYLIVPKYKNDIIVLESLNDKIYGDESENVFSMRQGTEALGVGLVGLPRNKSHYKIKINSAISEGMPWSPRNMNGILTLPSDVEDFTKIINEIYLNANPDYLYEDYNLKNYIISFWAKG